MRYRVLTRNWTYTESVYVHQCKILIMSMPYGRYIFQISNVFHHWTSLHALGRWYVYDHHVLGSTTLFQCVHLSRINIDLPHFNSMRSGAFAVILLFLSGGSVQPLPSFLYQYSRGKMDYCSRPGGGQLVTCTHMKTDSTSSTSKWLDFAKYYVAKLTIAFVASYHIQNYVVHLQTAHCSCLLVKTSSSDVHFIYGRTEVTVEGTSHTICCICSC